MLFGLSHQEAMAKIQRSCSNEIEMVLVILRKSLHARVSESHAGPADAAAAKASSTRNAYSVEKVRHLLSF